MLIDCISDLHGFFPDLAGGDILIIAGDLTARNTKEEYDAFISWLTKLPYRCKIVVAGNHDGLIEQGIVTISNEKDIHYLCDSGIEFEGLKIWGSPYTPTFGSWYFMCNRGEEIKKHWDCIPSDIDILVTHGPPYGIFDKNLDGHLVGCEELRKAVQERIKPRIHCFGHIHEGGASMTEIDGTTYVNCSYVDVQYRPVNRPIHLTLEPATYGN
jgi:Icc-related predicted phosphoesterase